MSEVYLRLECSFEQEEKRSAVFQGVYSHAPHCRDHSEGLAIFRSLGVDASDILRDDRAWELSDCGVDASGKLFLRAMAGPDSGYVVFPALLRIVGQAGASGVLGVLSHTGAGIYEALTTRDGKVETVYTTDNYEEVGDDFFDGMKQLLVRHLEQLSRLRSGGML